MVEPSVPVDVDPPRVQSLTWTRDFPAEWPTSLCEAQLANELWDATDLRVYRHFPQVRTQMWAARRASVKAFRAMRAAHEKTVQEALAAQAVMVQEAAAKEAARAAAKSARRARRRVTKS